MINDHMKNDEIIPMSSVKSGNGIEVLPNLYCYTNQIVNIVLIGVKNCPNDWVLVDCGMPKSKEKILEEVTLRFGENARPQAIVLTHGHFDHVGASIELAQKWDVPIYAHPLELPYLTGQKHYPAPDPSVEGGLVAKMAGFFPKEPINLISYIHELPADGSVPGLPDWEWIHTPGHTEGHVSFFRKEDRALIAGDAFITVKQDSLLRVIFQMKEVNGPPRYFTPDWEAAWDSVKKLAALNPAAAITGHGQPMIGEELKEGLSRLANRFQEIAVPDYGKFVDKN